jgi:uncharacterized repeat protein (TIGR01451 family)
MTIRRLAVWGTLFLGFLLSACGGGSGRSGTDVVVTGSGPSGQVLSGETAVFVMTVSNTGSSAANNVQIIDTVGNQLVPTAITCTASGGAVCPNPTSISMTIPSLPGGGSLVFGVTVQLTPAATGTIINTMSASYSEDVDHGNNSATVSATAASTSISVEATAPTGPIFGGATANFTMVVTNIGQVTALDVGITDTVSEDLTLGTITCVASNGATCPTSTGATMVAPAIPPTGVLTFTVPAVVTAGANGTVSNQMTVAALGDSKASDDSDTAFVSVVSNDVGVSQTGAATAGAGGTTVFTAIVANPGPNPATNITIHETLTTGYAVTVTCTPSGGATCPTTLGQDMTVASLPAGRSLSFSYTVTVPSSARGNIVNTVQITADADPNTANNSASTTTVAVAAGSGSYKVFAADGREYDLTIDFDAGAYTMTGNGQTWQKTFTVGSNGDFVVSGTSRFRVATDLIVGGHDFGGGVQPYVAAREFATTLFQVVGTYNLATRNLPAAGSPFTHAGTAQISENTLFVCQSDTQVNRPSSCASGALTSYSLTVNGDVFTGVDLSDATKTYTFRVARSGASTVLLSAGVATDGSRQFRIGLPDGAAIAGGVLYGATTTGDWVTMTLGSTSYAVTGVLGGSDSATLQLINPAGPFAMRFGLRTSDSQKIYVMQAFPVAVAFGDFSGGASGLMQIALP